MILIWNPGSTSLRYKLYQKRDTGVLLVKEESIYKIGYGKIKNHSVATRQIFKSISKYCDDIKHVGYRVVHGGRILKNGDQANQKNINQLKKLKSLAPIHNPVAVKVIESCKNILKCADHRLFFDTDYFKDIPNQYKIYPISRSISQKYKIERFGFHGLSHRYVARLADPNKKYKVITIHLGAGCSIAAIDHGEPIINSMGFTPNEGLVMETRSGDIDPGLVLYLVEKIGLRKTSYMINYNSGLSGLTDYSGNMLDILYQADKKIEDKNYIPSKNIKKNNKTFKKSNFALLIYINSIKRYIGAYSALMGGADVVVFTGKVGSGSSYIRDKVLNGLEFLRVKKIKSIVSDEEKEIALEIKKIFW